MSRIKNTRGENARKDQLLADLYSASQEMSITKPPASVWEEIESTLDKKVVIDKKIPPRFKWDILRNIAAVVTIGITCWVGWSNYQLQNQFSQILVQNQLLELQLHNSNSLSYSQAHLLINVEAVENQLFKASTKEERLKLLEQRRSYINSIIELQNGKSKEFYL